MAEKQGGLSRRKMALLGLVLVSILIGVLIRYEMISVLYILATLSLVILLLIVAFADLETIGREAADGFAGKKG